MCDFSLLSVFFCIELIFVNSWSIHVNHQLVLFFARLESTSKIPLQNRLFKSFAEGHFCCFWKILSCLFAFVWLVEWRKIIAARAACTFVQFFDVVCKWRREISKFKVLTTTWSHNSKSFILYTYFSGASTRPFAACSVNNKGCEEEAIITISLIFKWRFHCLCCRWCLSSLISARTV